MGHGSSGLITAFGSGINQPLGPGTLPPAPSHQPNAPVGTSPSVSNLLDLSMGVPNLPNPYTAAQFLAGGGGSGQSYVGSAGKSIPGYNQQPLPAPSLVSGGYHPSLPNPDIGTKGYGGIGVGGQPQRVFPNLPAGHGPIGASPSKF